VRDHHQKLENRKREIAQQLDRLTATKRLERLQREYRAAVDEVTGIVDESGNDHERRQLHDIIATEETFLHSPQKLQAMTDRLHGINFQILRRTPKFLIDWFQYLVGKREVFNDQLQAKSLIEAGKKHMDAEDYDALAQINSRLHSLLPQMEKDTKETRFFTGIS
jgi:hypothetical protein